MGPVAVTVLEAFLHFTVYPVVDIEESTRFLNEAVEFRQSM
jgi:hypothetical protein